MLAAAKRLIAGAALCLCASVAANPDSQSAPWNLNGNGYPGDVRVQQSADGTLSGTIYGEPLTGYYASGERIGVWLRGAPSRPIQAYVGGAAPDGMHFAGRFYGLNGNTSGATAQRNVFAFTAVRAAAAPPPHPGVPTAAPGPASVAGALAVSGNGHAGSLVLSQAADGTLSGTIYGDALSGHYAAGTGTIAFLRFTGAQPTQLYVGTATPQGISGEFYALAVAAGASSRRMRYAWTAQPAAAASAPAPQPQVTAPAALIGPLPAPRSAAASPPPPPTLIGPSAPPQTAAAAPAPGAFIGPAPAMKSETAALQVPLTASDGPPALQYEIVHGPETRAGPSESARTYADCPAGKTALSVGYRVRAVNSAAADAIFGVEIGSVFPDKGRGEFSIKNANVFEPLLIQAIVICIRSHPSIQYREQVITEYGLSNVRYMPCSAGERLAGGGFWRLSWGTHPTVYAPRAVSLKRGEAPQPVWMVSLIDTDNFSHDMFKTRAVCVPASWLPDWELLDRNAVASLGPRAAANVTASCVNGTKVLAAGVESLLGGHEFVSAALAPSAGNPRQWFATVLNRAVIQQYPTQARMSIICARVN